MKWTIVLGFVLTVLAAYSRDEMRSLYSLQSKKDFLHVTEQNFQQIIYGDRDYGIVLQMLSNSPQVNCLLCRDFQPHYERVANSYAREYKGNATDLDVYFMFAEFDAARALFKLMKLELIPKVFYFPPNRGGDADSLPTNYQEYPFYQGDHSALFLLWVTQITGHSFELHEPFDFDKLGTNAMAALVVLMFFRKFKRYIMKILLSRKTWGLFTIVLTLVFLAGYMFIQIRNVPLVKESGEDVTYIYPSSQMQYGFEIHLVAPFYGLAGLLVVLLANKVSTIRNAKVQFAATAIICVLIFVLYSIYLNIFNVKYKGYPFHLLEIIKL